MIPNGFLRTDKEPFLEPKLRNARIRRVKELIKHNSVVCDIGCGSPPEFLLRVSKNIKQGVGIDKSIKNTVLGNIILKAHHVKTTIPFKESSFDHVTMLAILEHFENPERVLIECNRILKKRGSLIITTPTPESKFILETLSFKFGLVSTNEIQDHKRYFSREALRFALKNANFKKVDIKPFQFGLNTLAIAYK